MADSLKADADADLDMDESGESATSMTSSELVGVVGDVASAFLSNPSNRVDIDQIPNVIGNIAKSLRGVVSANGGPDAVSPGGGPVPAVPIKKSVSPDAITCLDCGRKFQTIKRHLATEHGLSVDEYRAKWNLSADYPLVAPAHAEQRSRLAKELGLGSKRSPAAPAAPAGKPAKPSSSGKTAAKRGKPASRAGE